MSALAIYTTVVHEPRFWRLTKDAGTQTDPCLLQSIGYTVLQRCPNPEVVWQYIDAHPLVVDCGVAFQRPSAKPWLRVQKPPLAPR